MAKTGTPTAPDRTAAITINISPNSGPPGTLVTVNLEGDDSFDANSKVYFGYPGVDYPGDVDWISIPTIGISSSQLTFIVPPNVTCGSYEADVHWMKGPVDIGSNQVAFTVTEPCVHIPQITSLEPTIGSPGTAVIINGVDLRYGLNVQLRHRKGATGTMSIPSEYLRSGQLRFTMPPAAPCGFYDVSVTDPDIPRATSNSLVFGVSCPSPADWQIRLDTLEVYMHQESGFFAWKAGDEPYIVMIGFRSRFLESGSTETFWSGYLQQLGSNVTGGPPLPIPENMGVLSFPSVELRLPADLPEVLGAVVIAMESDSTPWSLIREIIEYLRDPVETKLRDLIEGGQAIKYDSEGNPQIDEDVIQRAIDEIKSTLKPTLSEKIELLLSSWFDPDELIGFNFVFFAAEPITPDMVEDIMSGGSDTLSEKLLLYERFLYMVFEGSGAQYSVRGSLTKSPAGTTIHLGSISSASKKEGLPAKASFRRTLHSPLVGQPVKFIDQSSPSDLDGSIVSWKWNFGDGATSTKQNPTHTYRRGGTFHVKLSVKDNFGRQGNTTQRILVIG